MIDVPRIDLSELPLPSFQIDITPPAWGRAVLDSNLQLPAESMLASTGSGEVIVFCSKQAFRESPRVAELEAMGLKINPTRTTTPGRLALDDILFDLDDRGQYMLIESGPTLADSFFEQNLCDRLWVIRSPKPIDEPTAPGAPRIPDNYLKTGEVNLDGDILSEYLNPQSPVYFSPQPSADIVRLM